MRVNEQRVLGMVVVLGWLAWAAAPMCDAEDAGGPYGLKQRVPWTTSRIKGTPDPPPPYRTRVAFEGLKFEEPLDMTRAPGTDRLFVVERYGKIFSFENRPEADEAELLIDLGRMTYGLAFHPEFQQNGYFYVTYILDPEKPQPRGTRVSRFKVRPGEPPKADPESERILVEWRSGGHNGGCLKFGPDGYLYIGTGDSSGIADQLETGQDLSDLSGSVLRIDVDREEDGRPYAIPGDNPFVDTPDARPEVWAYGLRQPWKLSFDRETGDLWTGNVGQDLWEQIFLIERGGNYGWSVMEGSHPFRPERERGPTAFVPPIVEHDHAEFRSITGGFVYHGTRLPELRGAYVYGDYDTGKVWMLRYDRETKEVSDHRELVDSSLRLVGFAEDHAGELYLLDHMRGTIHRLEPNPRAGQKVDFPRKLSETGLLASTEEHVPAAGVIPYSVNAPQWSDGAVKERFLAVPGKARIEFDGITYPQPAPGAPHGWKFPDGTVLFETLSLELEAGNPESRRRLETRVLHYEQLEGSESVGDQFWRGYTYVWNDEQTEAVLLEEPRGLDRTFTIRDPQAPRGERRQTWHFPSRAECTVCHNMAAKYVLGVNTLQMNREHDYGGVVDNQLRSLEHVGMFHEPLPAAPKELPRLVDYRESGHDLDARARSYLHANCAHCHRKWGGGNADFRLLATIDLEEMGIVAKRPGHGAFFIPDASLVAPGAPERSVLLYRMAKLGPGRMPRIGSSVVDELGWDLMYSWIESLPGEGKPGKDSELEREVAALAESEPGGNPTQARIERLLGSTSGALRLVRAVDTGRIRGELQVQVIGQGASHPAPHVRDLFERYLPEEERTQRLGSVVNPEEILGLEGDAARGRELFLKGAGVQCRSCHKIQGEGKDVGPDLSEIGKKYKPRQLLETILEPSKVIEPKYLVYLAVTDAGQVHTGLLVEKSDKEIVLKTAKNELVRLAAGEVEQLAPQRQSLMPELLVRDLTAQQVADLLSFLRSLK